MDSPGKKTRLIIIAASLIIVALIIARLLYGETLFMSESSLLKAQRTSRKGIPAEQNAWPEYEKAILAMNKTDWDTSPFEPWWREPREKKKSFTPEEKAFLDKFDNACRNLKAGASKPGCRYFEQGRGVGKSPAPSQVKMLDYLIFLQCSRLLQEGKMHECAGLGAAMYRFTSDLFDSHSGDVPPIASIMCANTSITALFDLLNSGPSGIAVAGEILPIVHSANLKLPSAYEFTKARYGWYNCFAEDVLLNGREDPWEVFYPSTVQEARRMSLRSRKIIIHTIVSVRNEALAAQEQNLRNWDFEGYWKTSEEYPEEVPYSWSIAFKNLVPGSATRACAYSLSSINGNALSMGDHEDFFSDAGKCRLMKLYLYRADGSALEAIAAVLAYGSAHGKFPGTIEEATKEMGIPVPNDPATGTPIGYRLEKGQPVFWLPGFDRKDNGGKEPYRHRPSVILEGTDLVYRLGETPVHRGENIR